MSFNLEEALKRRNKNYEEYLKAVNSFSEILTFLGEDLTDDGLIETPERVIKALLELTKGNTENPEEILNKVFDVRHDELVIVKNIHFNSLCMHHLLGFTGVVHVCYLPGEKIVGLSKLARLVDCYANRLQVQERLTQQIAQAIMEHLNARGAGVIIKGKHSCMSCRGIKKEEAEMVTSSMLGALRDNESTRNEFLKLITI